MKIDKYQKIFGVGPLGAFLSLVLLACAWWLDRKVGHPRIAINSVLKNIIATFLIIIGFGLHLWTFQTLRKWWMKDKLCTTGPFRYFRHPMYAAWITFICLGISLYFNSWIFLFWYVLLQPVWHSLVVKEEAMMTDTFGSEYQKYMASTGRFIPKVFKNKE